MSVRPIENGYIVSQSHEVGDSFKHSEHYTSKAPTIKLNGVSRPSPENSNSMKEAVGELNCDRTCVGRKR